MTTPESGIEMVCCELCHGNSDKKNAIKFGWQLSDGDSHCFKGQPANWCPHCHTKMMEFKQLSIFLGLKKDEEERKEFEQYEHHGNEVWVRSSLKGTHRNHCLCHTCDKFKPETREGNCPIANAVYANCLQFKLVTPVYECPEFVVKEK